MSDPGGGGVPYALEKRLWSDADFERMGWHDATVHAIAFRPEEYDLLLDIDYILHWVQPVAPDTYFRFWVAPATLRFANVSEGRIDLSVGGFPWEVQDLHRTEPRPTPNGQLTDWKWLLDTTAGEIAFRATGYCQYFRAAPRLSRTGHLSPEERGGLSFALSSTD